MNYRLLIFLSVALGACGSTAMAQTPLVPAIPGAPITPPVIPAPVGAVGGEGGSPQQIAAQMQELRRRAALEGRAADQAAANERQMQTKYDAVLANRGADMAAASTPVGATGAELKGVRPGTLLHLQDVPRAPSEDEIAGLRRRLDDALAQRRTERVADDGTLSATSAAEARSAIIFPYEPEALYEVYSAPDHMTTIELQPGEVITTPNGKPKAADTVQWVADTAVAGQGPTRRTIVLIKPTMTGIETNMLIPTNRHIYNILLRSVSRAYMPVVAFDYPLEDLPSTQGAAPAEQQTANAHAQTVAAVSSPDNMNFNYRIKGAHVVWSPLRVFDDGSKTFLQMSPQMHSWEAPALFVMEDKKTPLLVNYRVKGDYYIVDRLFHHAQLRIGAKQVVNVYRLGSKY